MTGPFVRADFFYVANSKPIYTSVISPMRAVYYMSEIRPIWENQKTHGFKPWANKISVQHR